MTNNLEETSKDNSHQCDPEEERELGAPIKLSSSDDIPTSAVPFKPIEQKKCQVYYRMPESMKRVLCQYCDMFGRVKTEFGSGKCMRYEE